MLIDILTVFPQMFIGPLDVSIVARAKERDLVEIRIHDLRLFTSDRRKTVDDRPYGGGSGMVMMVEPIDRALGELKTPTFAKASVGRQNSTPKGGQAKRKTTTQNSKVILLSPQGKVFNQKKALELSKLDHLIFIAGHYEGVDERVREHLVDETISIGDYVLTGGELPAMVVVDAVVRLLPGALGDASLAEESFSLGIDSEDVGSRRKLQPLLEYPQYTRPEVFKGWAVPTVLLSGNHQKIAQWRKAQTVQRTRERRPDLLKTGD